MTLIHQKLNNFECIVSFNFLNPNVCVLALWGFKSFYAKYNDFEKNILCSILDYGILILTEYFSKKLCFAFLPGKGLFFLDLRYYITKSSEYVLNIIET